MSSDGPGFDQITSRPVLPPIPLPFRRTRTVFRLLGLAGGVGSIFAFSPALTPDLGPAPLPMLANVEVTRTGEVSTIGNNIALSQAPVSLGLASEADGGVAVQSITWVPVAVSVQDGGTPTGIEDEVHLEVRVGDKTIFSGPRSQLIAKPSSTAVLQPGQSSTVGITVSVPAGAPDVYQGRTSNIKLRLIATTVED